MSSASVLSTTRGPHRPAWLAPLSFVLCLAGLAISAYMTYEHFTGSTSLFCTDSAAVNCLTVTTSRWSRFLGMPVAVLGLGYFVVMTMLCLPQVWRRGPRVLDHVRLLGAAGGLVMVLWLVYAELMKIHAICLWCTGVHVITLLLLLTLAVGAILTYDD